MYKLTLLSGMSNTSDFVLKKEDHTLGNLLSEHLKLHPNVLMAGYKRMFFVPIPISFLFVDQVQFTQFRTADRLLQWAIPTSPSFSSVSKQMAQCPPATSSHLCARSSSISSRCCTKNSRENGNCGVLPTLASRATCNPMGCKIKRKRANRFISAAFRCAWLICKFYNVDETKKMLVGIYFLAYGYIRFNLKNINPC